MLSESLAAAGKREVYEAYYFPAHAYRLSSRTHAYTTGLAVLARSDVVIDDHNAGAPHDIASRFTSPNGS